MKRCVIIGGAAIGDYETVRSYLRRDDFIIFCDCGLKHVKGLRVDPDLTIGDFDSWDMPEESSRLTVTEEEALSEHLKKKGGWSSREKDPGSRLILLPHKKDDTDTVFAVKEGIQRGFDEFLLLGVTGQRMDHTLANIYTLLLLREHKKHGMIVDDFSEMVLAGKTPEEIGSRFPFFSLISLAGSARHITIENALYCLADGEISSEYQYGISNEVLPGKTARVSCLEGALLLIRVRKDNSGYPPEEREPV